MKDFIKRLSSRKFLLAVAAMITAAANQQWHVFAATAFAYLGSEGLGDAVGRFSDAKYAQIAKDAQQLLSDLGGEDDVDKGVITSGVVPPTP
jgi:hypothetical protein